MKMNPALIKIYLILNFLIISNNILKCQLNIYNTCNIKFIRVPPIEKIYIKNIIKYKLNSIEKFKDTAIKYKYFADFITAECFDSSKNKTNIYNLVCLVNTKYYFKNYIEDNNCDVKREMLFKNNLDVYCCYHTEFSLYKSNDYYVECIEIISNGYNLFDLIDQRYPILIGYLGFCCEE